ncbi:hypothetical protein [Halostella pelagica]|uniref:hypothetical protein n=1 Tax=Halostella pelagica TaxID=2583824 RepID=UPI001080CEE1|nr:hypothetical protein [Halostella pelagica]
MKRLPTPRRSALVARVEVRRTLRSFVENRTRLALTALSGVFVLAVVAAGSYGVYLAGQALRSGSDLGGFDVTSTLRGVVGLVWVGISALVAARAVAKRGTVPKADGLLTTIPTADAVGGILLSELIFVLLWTLPPLVLLTGSFSYGAGTPGPFIVMVPVVATLGALGVATGYPVGLLVRQAVTRYDVLAKHRQVLFAFAFLGYLALVFGGGINEIAAVLLDPLARTPVGWLGDLLLVGIPGIDGSLARATVAPAAVLAAVVPALAVTVRIAAVHWFSDPAGPTSEDDNDAGGRFADVLPALPIALPSSAFSRPTRAVAGAVVRRAVRAPIKLSYVIYPLFGVIPVAQSAIEQGRIPASLPYALALYAAWASGVLVTLNPFGDQGAVLPGTLTTPLSGRQFVAGHVVVAAGLMVPLTVILAVGSGLASPLSLASVAELAVGAGVLAALMPLLATGIGALFPRYGAVNVVGNRKAVMPSKRAFLTYSVTIAAAGLAAGLTFEAPLREAVAALVTVLVPRIAVSPGTLETVGIVALAAALVSPFVSVAYAVRRFESYHLH